MNSQSKNEKFVNFPCPSLVEQHQCGLLLRGKWKGTRSSFRSRLTAVGAGHPAEPYQSLLPLENAVQDWLDQPIGELDRTIPPEGKLEAALYGSQVAALFNQVQLAETGADFSCTSLGNDPGRSSSSTPRKPQATPLERSSTARTTSGPGGLSATPSTRPATP